MIETEFFITFENYLDSNLSEFETDIKNAPKKSESALSLLKNYAPSEIILTGYIEHIQPRFTDNAEKCNQQIGKVAFQLNRQLNL